MTYLVTPNWQLPSTIHAAYSFGWASAGHGHNDFGDFNLAQHVGDNPDVVAANREALTRQLHLSAPPLWLSQVHGIEVAKVGESPQGVEADAVVSRMPRQAAAVLTADCLPVLFYVDGARPVVAAAHAGWRGLATGVLEATFERMAVPACHVRCWLGPAIGPTAFEVGEEVRACFVQENPASSVCFQPAGKGKWFANLAALAALRLRRLGIEHITASELCTVGDTRFYSYRRAQGQPTGRMVSLIWFS